MAEKVQSGFVDVALSRPLSVSGAEVKALRMREPTVADQLVSEEMKGTDSAKEIAMLSNLCDVTPDEIKSLTLRDYKKVQAAFLAFIA
jgi:Phage tail assembly chaperone proteins, E, or 41 or 14